jgi:nitroimidazol reductase NimA-like FMN-containing flavoprotein (pyridoxamine 5'-phosphate oxidase superfamily)
MLIDPSQRRSLGEDECLRLLSSATIGRIVYTANALPAIQPVHYVLDRGRIIIRSDGTPKLAAPGRHDVVAFEVDDLSPATGGWSVTVLGWANAVDDPAEIGRLDTLPFRPWVPDDPCGTYITIDTALVTGHQLQHMSAP